MNGRRILKKGSAASRGPLEPASPHALSSGQERRLAGAGRGAIARRLAAGSVAARGGQRVPATRRDAAASDSAATPASARQAAPGGLAGGAVVQWGSARPPASWKDQERRLRAPGTAAGPPFWATVEPGRHVMACLPTPYLCRACSWTRHHLRRSCVCGGRSGTREHGDVPRV
jgi:hypothetical protein